MREAEIRKRCLQILNEAEWICWHPSKVRFKQNDVFGIIDVLAVKGKQKKNIQLTTLANVSARRRKILDFLRENKVELCVEIWAWDSKSKGFRKEKVNGKTVKEA